MARYYYIGTALPALYFDVPPEISLSEFEHLLKDNLTEHDYEKTQVIRNAYDILNLKSLWLEEELDFWGNYDAHALEEALVSQVGLPQYIYDFIEAHEKVEDRIRYFPALLARFFKEETAKHPKGFLHDYITFEREWRLVFLGFRAKKLGRDLSVELQYEDPEEDFIAQLLAQKDAKTFEPPEKYHELKVIFDKFSDDPMALQRAVDEYRFNYIENLVSEADEFSIDRILAYMACLIIVQKWFEQDKAKGAQIVDTILKEIL